MSYTNADGLQVINGTDQGAAINEGNTVESDIRTMVVEIPDATAILSSAATPEPNEAFIPSGSYIKSASLLVETAFTSAGAATLTIGLQESDGTAIDADGIDATVAKAALAANLAVACDGALVGGTALVQEDAYISMIYGTAVFTAGKGKLVIEYITP
jgi:hypothetical protein